MPLFSKSSSRNKFCCTRWNDDIFEIFGGLVETGELFEYGVEVETVLLLDRECPEEDVVGRARPLDDADLWCEIFTGSLCEGTSAGFGGEITTSW